jgi:hypothetical protein
MLPLKSIRYRGLHVSLLRKSSPLSFSRTIWKCFSVKSNDKPIRSNSFFSSNDLLHIPPKKLVHNVRSMSSILINHFSTFELEQWMKILISLREKPEQKAKTIDLLQRSLANTDIASMKPGLNDTNKRVWFKKWLLNVINLSPSEESKNRKNPFPVIINLDLPEIVVEKQLNIASLLFLYKSKNLKTTFYQQLKEKVVLSSSLSPSNSSSVDSSPTSSSSNISVSTSTSLKNEIVHLKESMESTEKELYKQCINTSFQFNFLPLEKLTKLEMSLHDLVLSSGYISQRLGINNNNNSSSSRSIDQYEPFKEFLTKLTRNFPNHLAHPVIQQLLDFLYFNSVTDSQSSSSSHRLTASPELSSSKIFIDRYFPKAIIDSKIRRNELFEKLSFELTHLINEYYLFYQKMEAETAASATKEVSELLPEPERRGRPKTFTSEQTGSQVESLKDMSEDSVTNVPRVSTVNLRFLKDSHIVETTLNYVFEIDFQCFKRHSASTSGFPSSSSSSSVSSVLLNVDSSMEDVVGSISSRYAAIEKSMKSPDFHTPMTYARDRVYTHDPFYRLADSSSFNKIFIDNLPPDVDRKMLQRALRHYLTPTEQEELKVWIFRYETEKEKYRQSVDEVNHEILAHAKGSGDEKASPSSSSATSSPAKDLRLIDLLKPLDLRGVQGTLLLFPIAAIRYVSCFVSCFVSLFSLSLTFETSFLSRSRGQYRIATSAKQERR